jgi:ribokinase
MSPQKPIVVVGSINMDLVAHAAHIPAPGETILGASFLTNPGGKGANQAVAVARLGYPVQMIGQLGSDDLGRQMRAYLTQSCVDTAAIGTVPGSSGVALITVSAKGDNSIVVIPGANSHVTPAWLDQHAGLIRSAAIVLAQLEIPLETVLRLAQLCSEAQVPLMLDPAPARELPPELFPLLAWITPNETEAAFYLGHRPGKHGYEIAAGELLRKGIQGVVLKLGAEGSYLADASGRAARVAPFPVTAVDSTAAGDAFNGAFATALSLGQSPAEAARFASAASAISVTRHGAQASMASRAEVDALLAHNS